ncbi:2-methoxy-6-polyprenyl-1 4-benzoquinol methylase mitochondrial [Ceratocystis platani]|uniref:2-methoxy-6-polyprenyl-1,4-benzoquinol methylase, mitochondrial n=1 Tax=Ceratocystis fimbriata f. sp. platani TaxID=88771 RepID=A0A0F8DH72_CERFI|nr:2-methoxy-6-polyprenyl-1 4-benzoquinol methylase mitochondrial [Ceratocystis platani]
MPPRPALHAVQRSLTTPSSISIKTSTFISSRCLSYARASMQGRNSDSSEQPRTTHFGFQTVRAEDKEKKVAGVFTSVAESYDRMNDLMSFGWHRVWKDHFVSTLSPGLMPSQPATPLRLLDIAGGTGDIAFRLLHHAIDIHGHKDVQLTISDINSDMLKVGEQRARATLPSSHLDSMKFLTANAQQLPPQIADNSIDLYTVSFGIRNFTDIPAALREAYRVLKPGGVFACLEFSSAEKWPLFNAIYKRWSFSGIPMIGQVVAGDRDSYQYLVESIERFPNQERFKDMILDAGFTVSGKGYEDLTMGVAAIHKGIKPLQ